MPPLYPDEIPFDDDEIPGEEVEEPEVAAKIEPQQPLTVVPTTTAAAPGTVEEPEARPRRKPKAAQPKAAPQPSGQVNVLLDTATDQFELLSDEQLVQMAGTIARTPTLHLVKGEYFAPEITFKRVE